MERDVSALKVKFGEALRELPGRLHGDLRLGADGMLYDDSVSPSCSYDETWLLRYIMSAKGSVGKAESNTKQALAYRREKAAWVQVRGQRGSWKRQV